MEKYLQDYEGTFLFVGMIASLFIAAVLEAAFPRRPESPYINQRWANNFGLIIINHFSVNALMIAATIAIAWWGEEQETGLLRHVELDFWPSLLLAILVFEFIAYWFHRALHAFPWLWRLHAVHHSDTELDFTTTYRNHPLELFVNAPLAVPAILLFGFPVAVVTSYQLLKTSISIIAHSNIRLPQYIDQIIRYVVVTPDYHRLHHCSDRQFTDSNYCAAFPLYDYLFGTAKNRPYAEHEFMELGLNYFRAPEGSRIDRLLLMPFVWRSQQGQESSSRPEST